MAKKITDGYVYILTSQECEFIKIGGTSFLPPKRVKEINTQKPYNTLGKWELADWRQVTDWRLVEQNLHFTFKSKRVRSIKGQKELFRVSPVAAAKHLDNIDETLVARKPKIDRLFHEQEFAIFLARLFRASAMLNWLDLQGGWTLSLFPSTSGGRYYTLNIGTHEVAFATAPKRGLPTQMIHMDSLICSNDFKKTHSWLKQRSGNFYADHYISALPHSISVIFEGDFRTAQEFLSLPGVRRAIIAYWTEALIQLQEKGNTSLHVKHHNWNAVAELKKRILLGALP